jgi:KaiC/GvpD/RAD55 family RecA-like ATPase
MLELERARALMSEHSSAHEEWQKALATYDEGDYRNEAVFQSKKSVRRTKVSDSRENKFRYKLLNSADIAKLPPLKWLVRGVLPSEGLCAVYGASGSGKSFLVLDLATAVAEGSEWFGYPVSQTNVAYVALEGEAGYRQRVKAWEMANGRVLPDGLRLVLQPFNLGDPTDTADLAAAIKAEFPSGAVVILDTLNRAASGCDENASADMGRLIAAARELREMSGFMVLLVHHSGKDATRGLRGHSSLHAALDAAIEVRRDGDRRKWVLQKAKDAGDDAEQPFRLVTVELEEDEYGKLVKSCVVRPDYSDTSNRRKPNEPKGGNQKLVLDGLEELLKDSCDFGKGGAPAHRPCVQLEKAVAGIGPRLTCEPKRRNERARTAITALIANGIVGNEEGWLWLR